MIKIDYKFFLYYTQKRTAAVVMTVAVLFAFKWLIVRCVAIIQAFLKACRFG